ncbi:amidophosphoribosyltransferase-like isoform X2 [Littorina saxatilis]|uniref:Amidophosphoribosyltransferase n=1 Tax=Littorina saxatilis TaxID=31220 RepID=A0AAN9B1Y5_9CAEN
MSDAEADVSVDDYGLREACGLFGCVANARGGVPSDLDVSHTLHMGLVGVQHRGQESAGIVTSFGTPNAPFCIKKCMGLVNNAFCDEDLKKLRGNIGIGHTRYSTQGDSDHVNIQPFVVETLQGRIAVAHNGELVNAKSLKKRLLLHGVGLSTGSDSELLTQLLTHQPECGEPNGADWLGRIKKVMGEASISYSLLIMLSDRVYAVRDPYGNRPLCLGKLLPASAFGKHYEKKQYSDNELDGWVVSSESCAFNAVGAVYYREVLPGEVVEITSQGFKSKLIVERPKGKLPAFCFFEYVYFARPDSLFEGQMVYTVRKRCGKQLAMEAPVEADLVSTVPDSATPAAIEYAHMLGIPFENVLCKNTYVGRTFIQPTTRLRQLGVAKKFGPLFENLDGKRIVLIDDSIVRGNTMGSIVRLLKRSGAKEVHIRVASPPIKYPCYMGINVPTREELIANLKTVEEIREYVGADSLHYLSIEGLLQAVEEGLDKTKPSGHCVACLTGNYPVTPEW